MYYTYYYVHHYATLQLNVSLSLSFSLFLSFSLPLSLSLSFFLSLSLSLSLSFSFSFSLSLQPQCGYKLSIFRCLIFYPLAILPACTGLLLAYWFPHAWVRLTCSSCSLSSAHWVVVKVCIYNRYTLYMSLYLCIRF